MRKLQLICATVLSFLLLNELKIDLTTGNVEVGVNTNSAAYARSSGGRSGGGSFGSGRSGGGSFGGSSAPTRSSPSGSGGSGGFGSSPSRSSPTRSGRGNPAPTAPRPSQTSPSPSDTSPSRGNTGGRVRGGEFERPQSPLLMPSSPRPYRDRGRTYAPSYPANQPYYPSDGGTVIVPVPVPVPVAPAPYYIPPGYYDNPYQLPTAPIPGNPAPSVSQPVPTYPQSGYSSRGTNSSSSRGFLWGFVLFLLVVGGMVAIAFIILVRKNNRDSPAKELNNDVVTVSKLQVALYATARDIQSHLTDISLSADLETKEGLTEFLQESALTLLRHPEYWTHVLASSLTVKSREEAARIFEQLSIEERSKFSAETFTKVRDRVRYRQAPTQNDEGPAAYIVVTLLIGTEDDKPLFGNINSPADLEQTLKRVAAITPDYLLIFELLWSPQEETDSLTYDELLTEYTDMIQIA